MRYHVLALPKHANLLRRIGLGSLLVLVRFCYCALEYCTNGANDAGAAVNLLGLVLGVQRGLPFQLGAVIEVCKSVRHLDDWLRRLRLRKDGLEV